MHIDEPRTGSPSDEADRLDRIFDALGWTGTRKKRAANELVSMLSGLHTRSPEYSVFPESMLGGGMERAEEEGEKLKRRIMASAGMLPPEQAAARAGISRQALDLRRRKNQALAVEHGKRGYRYPAWQFSGKVAATLPGILQAIGRLDPWSRYFLLTEPEPLLSGRSVIESIRAGDVAVAERVIQILIRDEAR